MSAVAELNRRAAKAGLKWHFRSSFEKLPATTAAASAAAASAKQLVRFMLTVAAATFSSTAPARRLFAQATARLPSTWTRSTADLWGHASAVLFTLWDRAASILPRGSAVALPAAALPIPASRISLTPLALVFASVFAMGAVADHVAPHAIHALQNGMPDAIHNGRTHAIHALQNGVSDVTHALHNGRTHAIHALQNGRAQAIHAVKNGRSHAAQVLQTGRAHAIHTQESIAKVIPAISKMRRASRASRDAQSSHFVDPAPSPPTSQDPKGVDFTEDLDVA